MIIHIQLEKLQQPTEWTEHLLELGEKVEVEGGRKGSLGACLGWEGSLGG
jgi:hypothetical protein